MEEAMKTLMVALFAALVLVPKVASAQARDPKAERLWKAKCASCHGADGKAQTEQGKKMAMNDITTPEWQKSFTDEKIKLVILNGVSEEKEGKKKQMDPFKDKLKPEQVDALVAYTRSLAAK